MENLEWKYADDPVTEEIVKKIGHSMGIKFPKDYIDCAKVNHGANVIPYCFDVEGIERVFGSLLSFDEESSDYIVKDYNNYRATLPNGVVPFGIDPAGNLICFDYKSHKEDPIVVFWEHEGAWEKNALMESEEITAEEADEVARENVYYIANNFTEFLNKLHD
ncbi:SMI1/KNR4 family protein [Bacillus pseudomycoides]|uniref:SMI1/KNR4 family protein n=1 Tax=Bacillus pseudomycoides TaxID=64104 RepID=UPI000BEE6DC6|nr:SMI1/KNR4 family protein [Bacillus pseudomycoides]PED05041.1 1,3-beta-glucan synthase regulator [Bacillus pseudomycoides]PEI88234.1 1,3-beta-glucan synthase regulator [Bacillus pseudomycoides]PEK06381.1 1,3-beta-glucan synthase regulator [Bacillus pseudomycoides]PEM67411.1 1,3-beta-glucan synthase regulator [Bacillus pseudomycoides]PEO06514.1 1,3-beta-glucan synthase regulator [Bacillus pseudomycoides]